MDEGPIAFQEKINIAPGTNAEELFNQFAELAAEKIPDAVLEVAAKGDAIFKEQDASLATYCKMTNREDGRIDFNESADKIMNRFRAYTPWPGIFTTYEGKRLKILDVELSEENVAPGKVLCDKNGILLGTAERALQVNSLQLEGKKALDAKTFILGQPKFCESQLPS